METTMPATPFSREEIDLIREWYNVVQDLNPIYLRKADQQLYKKVLDALDWPKDSGTYIRAAREAA